LSCFRAALGFFSAAAACTNHEKTPALRDLRAAASKV